jgi:hypothetical protein
MMITRNNYEAYMLDLMEGRLTPPEEAALNLFLEQNPDLDDDLPEMSSLESDETSFEFKEGLLFEEINKENRSFFFISASEGLLTIEQEAKLRHFLEAHSEYQKEFAQYQRASLTAENITFENKNTLIFEQEKGLIISLRPLRYIAAAIVLFIFSFGAIQLLQSDIAPLYSPKELALDKMIYTPDQEDVIETYAPIETAPKNSTQITKEEKIQTPPSKIEVIKDIAKEKVDLNIAQNEKQNRKNNDSIPPAKTEITPNNDIANNSIQFEQPKKSAQQTKAPTIGELIVQNAKDKLYNNPNAPEKNEFDSEIAALASAGMSAVSNKEQYINRNVNDSKKTKLSIGGFAFERVKH